MPSLAEIIIRQPYGVKPVFGDLILSGSLWTILLMVESKYSSFGREKWIWKYRLLNSAICLGLNDEIPDIGIIYEIPWNRLYINKR